MENNKEKEKSVGDKVGQTEAEGLEISLMPERAVVIPRIIRSRFLFFLAALIVILTTAIIVWLYASWHFEKIGMEVRRIQGEIQLLEAKSASYLGKRDEIIGLEDKAARVENILNNHIYWTRFFSLLESYTIPDIYFGDFSADTKGVIHLNATARDLVSVAKQDIVFSNAPDFIKEVKTSGIRKLPKGVSASFSLTLVDGVFRK